MNQILPGVTFGADPQIGEFAIIGVQPKGEGSLPTVFGARTLIRSHTVIYAGNVVGDDFQTGHGVLLRESNRIGNRVSIGTHSIVEHHVEIADGVRIHSNAFVPEFSVLEEECWIGPNVVMTNARYPQSAGAKHDLRGPHVGPRARVGANSTLLPGVVIGAEALIGAGTVVVRDVPAGAVVVGSPGRIIGNVADISAYRSSSS